MLDLSSVDPMQLLGRLDKSRLPLVQIEAQLSKFQHTFLVLSCFNTLDEVHMIDNDGNLTAGGTFSIMALVMAPIFLAIALFKLFFRAPLAAILGTAFCAALLFIGVAIFNASTEGMNPLGMVLVMGLAFCFAAGVAYGLSSFGWAIRFFQWECFMIEKSLLHGGILGRVFYILVQLTPGILAISLLIGTFFFSPDSGPETTQFDKIIGWLFLAWLAISQFVVLNFHRSEHPVGKFVSFWGVPFEENSDHGDVLEA